MNLTNLRYRTIKPGAQVNPYTQLSHCFGTKLKRYLEVDIQFIIDKVTKLKLALAMPNGQFSAATKI